LQITCVFDSSIGLDDKDGMAKAAKLVDGKVLQNQFLE
jgi:hypothetical protein